MPDDKESRIARIEYICNETIPEIKTFMKEGNDLRLDQAEAMGRIEECVVNFKKYQEACDIERAYQRQMAILADKRLTSLEGSWKRLVAIAVAAGGVPVFLVEGGAKAVTKLMDFFNV